MSETHLSELSFEQLGLLEPLMRGVADAGFRRCTPIQARTLPIALAGRDVAGQAQTGTGKTAAFLLGLMQYLLRHPADADRRPTHPRAIVLAPTRELAVQIHTDALVLGAHTGFTFGLAYGGTDYDKQRQALLRGVDVLIGTPGRLIDYYKQHVYDLRSIQVAVLDEADRMFDLGFIRDIRYVLRRLPPPERRLNMLFSATLGYRVLELAYEHMNDPELIRIEPDKVTVDRVRQTIYFPANDEKVALLVGLLRRMDPARTMVFVNTKRAAERVQRYLEANGINAEAISGDVPQRKRLRLLRDFQTGVLPVLVATDVASRGLHIPDVSHVFNFDLPQEAEDYVHRIGRTARAGAYGDAISFGCEDYAVHLPEIEAYIGHRIPTENLDRALIVDVKRPARIHYHTDEDGPPRRGGRDRRPPPRGARDAPPRNGRPPRGAPPSREGRPPRNAGGGEPSRAAARDAAAPRVREERPRPTSPAADAPPAQPQGEAGGVARPRRRRSRRRRAGPPSEPRG
jgi:ATP-dependent RNA helicase RhlB